MHKCFYITFMTELRLNCSILYQFQRNLSQGWRIWGTSHGTSSNSLSPLSAITPTIFPPEHVYWDVCLYNLSFCRKHRQFTSGRLVCENIMYLGRRTIRAARLLSPAIRGKGECQSSKYRRIGGWFWNGRSAYDKISLNTTFRLRKIAGKNSCQM